MKRAISIGRLSVSLAALVSVIALALSALVVTERLSSWRQSERQELSTGAIAAMGAALIELSLERSLVQVTLNLPAPIAPEYRAMIAAQRTKAARGFDEALATAGRLGTPEARQVADFVRTQLARLDALRREADAELARPAATRDAAVLPRWAAEVPAIISAVAVRRAGIRGPDDLVPVAITVREEVQQLAWAVREYGGRERTLLAIGIALATPLEAPALAQIAALDATVGRRLEALEALRERPGLPPAMREGIDRLATVWRGDYRALRQSITEAARAGRAYPIAFDAFFARSSEVLALAAGLSIDGGAMNRAYWADAGTRVAREAALAAAMAALALAASLALIWFVRRRVSGPAGALATTVERIAAGDLDRHVDIGRATLELDRIGGAVEVLRAGLARARAMEREAAAESAKRERQAVAIERHIQDFGASVSGVMQELGQAAEGMRASAVRMAEASETTRHRAEATAAGTRESVVNLGAVAAATEELSASVGEITHQVGEAAQTARGAVAQAEAAAGPVAALHEAAERIVEVSALITGIAGKTNLLALNATIEAARAGEAGKGFAVVAGEVKSLAFQTGQATQRIGAHIADIQGAIGQVVSAVDTMGGAIGQMDRIAGRIAAAIEEQGATTREIARSIAQVTRQAGTAEAAMHEVTEVAETGRTLSGGVLASADEVAAVAGGLRQEVDGFLEDIRRSGEDRRRYERVSVAGMQALIRAGTREFRTEALDISLGGMALRLPQAATLPAGLRVEVELPAPIGRVPARVARGEGDTLALAFISARDGTERVRAFLDAEAA